MTNNQILMQQHLEQKRRNDLEHERGIRDLSEKNRHNLVTEKDTDDDRKANMYTGTLNAVSKVASGALKLL